ncbi:SapC family protein [Sphingomonas sp. HDW15A]|uniref:SapC family protein n=1 Tax=Sphingomonas sp. HDW15A TaxID=2714942 RepID=UPI0014095CD6|nr:SapC family protein [Sphingomonas sp. HDW15A]QIK95552.1 SapC family protein [Sphingomonas sp. HDW15A]
MATQPQGNANLPLLYRGLEPLNSGQHSKMKLKRQQTIPNVGQVHAIPVTIDEFIPAQRTYPIIFSAGEVPVPLALMGLNEGVNTFIDGEGKPIDDQAYMPAYLRRFPFMLAKLRPDSDELSLCFDPTAGSLDENEGDALFDGDQPSDLTRNILAFCEQFETAGQRTHAFIQELQKAELLMEGEVSVQPEGADQPFVYRGFRMVDEEKLRNMRGDELRKLNQNGVLPLIFAHLMSLGLIRDLFYRQVQQGKGPVASVQPAPAGKTKSEKIGNDAEA